MGGPKPEQYVACLKRQSVTHILGQYVGMLVFTTKENRLLLLSFARIAPRRRYKRLQRDGSQEKAGDGTRTRDSLLGRHAVTKSTRCTPESAPQADPGGFVVN